MEPLEAKQVNGGTYYCYFQWAKVDGKCRRVWQKYLGKLEDIVQGADRRRGMPMCFSGDCRRCCGVNVAGPRSSPTPISNVPNEVKACPPVSTWPSRR